MRGNSGAVIGTALMIGIVCLIVFTVDDMFKEKPPPTVVRTPPPVITSGSACGATLFPLIYTDKETGCQYLASALGSPLIPRSDANGKPICGIKPVEK